MQISHGRFKDMNEVQRWKIHSKARLRCLQICSRSLCQQSFYHFWERLIPFEPDVGSTSGIVVRIPCRLCQDAKGIYVRPSIPESASPCHALSSRA